MIVFVGWGGSIEHRVLPVLEEPRWILTGLSSATTVWAFPGCVGVPSHSLFGVLNGVLKSCSVPGPVQLRLRPIVLLGRRSSLFASFCRSTVFLLSEGGGGQGA